MLTVQNRNIKIGQKPKFWNFTILYTTFVETLIRSMHTFFGENLLCTFRGDVVSHIWSHVNEKGKQMVQIQNLKFRHTL